MQKEKVYILRLSIVFINGTPNKCMQIYICYLNHCLYKLWL